MPVLDEHQRQGYATEAVTALVDLAFGDPHVRLVAATTYDTLQPSIRVLQKTGFVVVARAEARTRPGNPLAGLMIPAYSYR